jgi:catechol 2,3-dioxygenase-like lactoylglutathione lyase family enzyme
VIDHVGFEVSDLARSAGFYDAVFHALGGRRLHESSHSIAYGMVAPSLWIVVRGNVPAPGYGHVALHARGRAGVIGAHLAALANGGSEESPPALRPRYGPLYFAAYVRDPDGLRVEFVSGAQ